MTATTPPANASGAAPATITASFNWPVKSDGTDFSNAILVTLNGNPVAGTISPDSSAHSLIFTPFTALTPGTYTVTVDHVVSLTLQSDGVKIRAPYIFTFTVS